jgi:hypothetical protein
MAMERWVKGESDVVIDGRAGIGARVFAFEKFVNFSFFYPSKGIAPQQIIAQFTYLCAIR